LVSCTTQGVPRPFESRFCARPRQDGAQNWMQPRMCEAHRAAGPGLVPSWGCRVDEDGSMHNAVETRNPGVECLPPPEIAPLFVFPCSFFGAALAGRTWSSSIIRASGLPLPHRGAWPPPSPCSANLLLLSKSGPRGCPGIHDGSPTRVFLTDSTRLQKQQLVPPPDPPSANSRSAGDLRSPCPCQRPHVGRS
jgi:hypothetical protein